MSDSLKRFIIQANGFNFGPFDTPQLACEWAARRYALAGEADRWGTMQCEFRIAELRDPAGVQ